MYQIKQIGRRNENCLISDEVLTPDQFDEIARELGQQILQACKKGKVAGCRAREETMVVTFWKGEETQNTAQAGDWIVTNLNEDGEPLEESGKVNQYVIKPEKFASTYERIMGESEYGPLFRSRGNMVEILFFEAGIDILAPWNERQTVNSGLPAEKRARCLRQRAWHFQPNL